MQQITFAAGQTSASITVQTNEDTKFEGTESFSVLLAGGVDYTVNLASSGSTGVILDNDPAPLVSVVATDGAGTETVDGTDFTYTFSRTGDTSSALTVNYSIFPAPVDGATPGVDFPAQTGTITFAAGSSTAVLQFSAIDDAIIENTELFSVVVGVGAGYQVDIPNATAGGSITDNDFTPAVVSLTPATVETTEGGSLTFTFTPQRRQPRRAADHQLRRQRRRPARRRHPRRRRLLLCQRHAAADVRGGTDQRRRSRW